MKKIILVFIFILVSLYNFGQIPRMPVVQMPDVSENFDMSSVDIDRLSQYLELNEYQMEYLKVIHTIMLEEINDCIDDKGLFKNRKLDKAVQNNIKAMKKVLNEEQFKTYRELLTTTIRNNFNITLYNTFKDLPRRPRIPRRNLTQ